VSEPPVVLVVEDDSAIRSVIQAVLSDEGLEIELAADGRAAMQAAQRRRPALVLLDMMLPDGSGATVAADLKTRYGQDLPIIIVTADGTPEKKAAAAGAVAFVAKPFDVNHLVDLVLKHL
jgi:CheY-like chemotaxis protein